MARTILTVVLIVLLNVSVGYGGADKGKAQLIPARTKTALGTAAACLAKWEPEPPMSTARDSFTGGVINGKIYVFGGNGPDQRLKSTKMFNPDTEVWTNRADNNHNDGYGVEELTGAVVNGKLYVFGAYGRMGPEGHGKINFNERYDPNSDTWTSLAPRPTLVTGAPCTVYNGEIYVFVGGYCHEAQKEPEIYDVVEAYKPATDTWRFVTNIPKTLGNPAVATVGDKAYVIGGLSCGEGYLQDEDQTSRKVMMSRKVMTFDFQTEQWDTNSCEPLPANRARVFGYSSAAPVVNGEIFLIGGIEGTSTDNFCSSSKVDIYDTATNTWKIGPSLPLPARPESTLVLNDKIYVIGGSKSKSEVISLSIKGE